MSGAKRSGLKWPACTLLILAILGGTAYWGYDRLQAERAMTKARAGAQAQKAGEAAAASPAPPTYRPVFPLSFLAGFALVMAAILGSVIYFWWSLKDMEGGRRYDEEEEKAPAPDEAPAP